jgi:hypothetical protein
MQNNNIHEPQDNDTNMSNQSSQIDKAIATFLTQQRLIFDSNRPPNQDTYLSLNIGTHNINGLKGNKQKLYQLIEFMEGHDIDIMALNETNLNPKEGQFSI